MCGITPPATDRPKCTSRAYGSPLREAPHPSLLEPGIMVTSRTDVPYNLGEGT